MSRALALLALLVACDGGDPKDPSDDTDTTADDTDPVADDTDTPPDDTDTPPDDTDPLPHPDDLPLRGRCTDATRWGMFTLENGPDYGFATGVVSEGVVPVSVLTEVHTETSPDGVCTIWRRENPFCDPGCAPGFTCDLDGVCVPYPASQDVGTVTVDGLKQAVAMTPLPPGFTYNDTSLPNPPWEPGVAIRLSIAGGVYDPAELYGVGPAPLVSSALDWLVVQGEDLVVAWDAAPGGSRTEIVTKLRIDQHGRTPSNLECVFTDDGQATIPAVLIDELAALGLTGFPAGDLIRRTADSAPIDAGCVELITQSSQRATVEVDGYTPCRTDVECPPPLTCNELLERCE